MKYDFDCQCSKNVIECVSEEGVTIGLIDSLMTISQIIAERDLSSQNIKEALKDMKSNKYIKILLD